MTDSGGEALDEARRRLAEARRVLVLTGAGMSAESGVPTFRGENGLWEGHRPEELATPGAFGRDPDRVWAWYAWRRGLVARCPPHPGHRALAEWLVRRRDSALLVTQNVDGLHQAALRDAGGDSGTVVALHGDLFRVRCTGCGRETEDRSTLGQDGAPRCPDCGGLLRPGVVWFGEALPESALRRAWAWARDADVALVVGTSALVHPAATLPLLVLGRGREHGLSGGEGCIIEVNLQATPLTPLAALRLPGPAGSILPALLGPGNSGPEGQV